MHQIPIPAKTPHMALHSPIEPRQASTISPCGELFLTQIQRLRSRRLSSYGDNATPLNFSNLNQPVFSRGNVAALASFHPSRRRSMGDKTKTRAELPEMLAEAVRNTQPQPVRNAQPERTRDAQPEAKPNARPASKRTTKVKKARASVSREPLRR